MKKLLFILVLILGIVSTASAKEKSYKNGQITAYLSGDRVEIVDNDNNVCIVVTVERRQSSAGEALYYLACGNKYTKNITKIALKAAITNIILSAASAASAAAPAAATSIASDAYDDMCDYFGD